jgi:hypothetical protein
VKAGSHCYTEARLIDPIDKEKLLVLLNSVDTSSRQADVMAKKTAILTKSNENC